MVDDLNTGDIIAQIFMILIPLVVIGVIIFLIYSASKNKVRLKKIEEKLDKLNNDKR